MNDAKFGSFKCLIWKCRRGDKIIQPFCRIGYPQEIRSPLFNLSKFWKPQKSTPELYRMHLNLMNDAKFGSFKCLILKYRRRDQVIHPFCRTDSPEEIRSTPLYFDIKHLKDSNSSSFIRFKCSIHDSAVLLSVFESFLELKREDLISWKEPILQKGWIIWSTLLYLNIKYLKDPNSLSFIRFKWILHDSTMLLSVSENLLKFKRGDLIGSPKEIRSPLFNLSKFWKLDKSTAEPCRMHSNIINDEKFVSFKCLILKYRRGDQTIQPFCRIGSLQEIRSPSLIWVNFGNLRKVLLNYIECI